MNFFAELSRTILTVTVRPVGAPGTICTDDASAGTENTVLPFTSRPETRVKHLGTIRCALRELQR